MLGPSSSPHPYAEFVHRVEKPARYLGGEYGAVRKDWDSALARVCLAFPDVYDIGMSHLGFKILYKILNDDRMQEVPRERNPGSGRLDELTPSCETEQGVAYPPRRIVSLARKFGPNSLVQSICGDNLGPPIDIIVRQVLEAPQ